jgi:hypothetical protein
MTFEACLAELEAVAADLRASDPDELGQLAVLLERRQTAVGHLESAGTATTLEQLDRLRGVWLGGQDLEERIKLVREGVRGHAAELYRLQFHTRAALASMAAASPTEPTLEVHA